MFPETGFEVFVIRPPVMGNVNVYEHLALQVRYGSVNNFVAAFRLLLFCRSNRKAIFHAFNTGPFFLLIIRLAGIRKVVYSIRGTLHYSNYFQKVIRRKVWRLAIAKGYRLIANSEYSRDIFLRYIPLEASRINVLYNPISSDRIKFYPAKKRREHLNIIYAGRLSEGKNLFCWLDMAASIHKVRNDTRFFLYGDGPLMDELAEYSRSIGTDEYVSFRGFLPDISEAYHEADLMMFLSEYESFGNVVVECILCGTPVIASDIPSLREIFSNYPQFLVLTDNRMGQSILEKIDNIEDLKKVLPEVMAEFNDRFSTEQHIIGLKAVYGSLCSSAQQNR